MNIVDVDSLRFRCLGGSKFLVNDVGIPLRTVELIWKDRSVGRSVVRRVHKNKK